MEATMGYRMPVDLLYLGVETKLWAKLVQEWILRNLHFQKPSCKVFLNVEEVVTKVVREQEHKWLKVHQKLAIKQVPSLVRNIKDRHCSGMQVLDLQTGFSEALIWEIHAMLQTRHRVRLGY